MVVGQDLRDAWVEWQKLSGGKDADASDAGFYMGFVYGIAEGVGAIGMPLIPEGVAGDRVTAVVGKYLDAHAKDLNKPASIMVLEVFRAEWAWPRKK